MSFFNPTKEEQLKSIKNTLSKFDFDFVYQNNLAAMYSGWNSSSIMSLNNGGYNITSALMLHYDLMKINKTLESKFHSELDEITKLKKLLDDEAITQEEYDAKKKQLLNL